VDIAENTSDMLMQNLRFGLDLLFYFRFGYQSVDRRIRNS
jgi:hypothetical protein